MSASHATFGRSAARFVALFSLLTLLGCSPPVSPFRVVEVMKVNSSTAIYLEIDPNKAKLPWTLNRSQISVTTSDAKRLQPKAIAFKSALAFPIESVVIGKADEKEKLTFGKPSLSNMEGGMVGLLLMPREPAPGEIAILVDAPIEHVVALELTLPEGHVMTLAVPAKK